MKTTDVITLVMLAMERWSRAFSSQSTSPVAGLNAMAAAARMSGTRLPSRSRLKRGVIASRWSRAARAAAASRARAAAAARARARLDRVGAGLDVTALLDDLEAGAFAGVLAAGAVPLVWRAVAGVTVPRANVTTPTPSTTLTTRLTFTIPLQHARAWSVCLNYDEGFPEAVPMITPQVLVLQ